MAINYCETYMPISWQTIYNFAQCWEVTVDEIIPYSNAYLVDYNYNNYLIGVDSLEVLELISVNKFTGQMKYVGSTQDYAREYYDFN